jgi:hypothetical protein
MRALYDPQDLALHFRNSIHLGIGLTRWRNLLGDSYYVGKMKFGAALLLAAIPSFILLLILNSGFGLEGRALWYPCGCVFYTVAVFISASLDKNSDLFSNRDDRPILKLAWVHLCFLALFLSLFQLTDFIRPHLPAAILAEDRKGGSWAALMLITAILVVFFVEENWLATRKSRKK